MKKEIKTLKDLIDVLEETINIPDNHHLIPVFEDNDHNEIKGWIVAEDGVEADYSVYSSEDLLRIYGTREEKKHITKRPLCKVALWGKMRLSR